MPNCKRSISLLNLFLSDPQKGTERPYFVQKIFYLRRFFILKFSDSVILLGEFLKSIVLNMYFYAIL